MSGLCVRSSYVPELDLTEVKIPAGGQPIFKARTKQSNCRHLRIKSGAEQEEDYGAAMVAIRNVLNP